MTTTVMFTTYPSVAYINALVIHLFRLKLLFIFQFYCNCFTGSLRTAVCMLPHLASHKMLGIVHGILRLVFFSKAVFSPFPHSGQLELNLNKMPKPTKNAHKCNLDQIPGIGGHSKRKIETVSLFDMKRMNGWWPAAGTEEGEQILAVSHCQE